MEVLIKYRLKDGGQGWRVKLMMTSNMKLERLL